MFQDIIVYKTKPDFWRCDARLWISLLATFLMAQVAEARLSVSMRNGPWFEAAPPSQPTWTAGVPGAADTAIVTNSVSLAITNAAQEVVVSNLNLSLGGLVSISGGTLRIAADGSGWTGGGFTGGALHQGGLLTLTGPDTKQIGVLFNESQIRQTNSGNLNIAFGARLENLAGALYDFQGDADVVSAGGAGSGPTVNNAGTLRKSGGTGETRVGPPFNNLGGVVDVQSGTLTLAGGGTSFNGIFTASTGAVLDLTGGSTHSYSGAFSGSGGGRVELSGGRIQSVPSVTFNFPSNVFQWTGGTLSGPLTNLNRIILSGTNTKALNGALYNRGLLRQTNNGNLNVQFGGRLENAAAGTYEFRGDGDIVFAGGAGANPVINNSGTLRKSSGTGESRITPLFNNLGGTIQAQAGTLRLAGGGTSSNGTCTVSAGAVLDLTDGSTHTWSGTFSGSGAGRILLDSGTLRSAAPLTLNFPSNVFHWAGGTVIGPLTNAGTMTLSGTNVAILNNVMINRGIVRQTNSCALNLAFGSRLDNLASGVFEFRGDGSVTTAGGTGANPQFNNVGIFRKSGGAGTSVISATLAFTNSGAVEVQSGTLQFLRGFTQTAGTTMLNGGSLTSSSAIGIQGGSVIGSGTLNGALSNAGQVQPGNSVGTLTVTGAYSQSAAGSLEVEIGGRSPGEFDQLAVAGTATLNGALSIRVVNGFVPVPGDVFQVMQYNLRSGAFAATNGMLAANGQVLLVPSYRTNGVFLVATIAPLGPTLVAPSVVGGSFSLSFATQLSRSYRLETTATLSPPNWQLLQSILGDGTTRAVTVPLSNFPQQFFRVLEQ